MTYEEIINEKDTREALEFLLPRMHTVQCYNLIEMLLKKYNESANKVFLLIEIPNYLESEKKVIGAYLDKNTVEKDKDILTKEFKENNYRIEWHNILKE